MEHSLLIHKQEDSVGVVIRDHLPGETAVGVITEDSSRCELKVADTVPLGHKVALKSLSKGEPVLIYGAICGFALVPISQGEHVHVHNMVSARWN